jgi:hypothetical protein
VPVALEARARGEAPGTAANGALGADGHRLATVLICRATEMLQRTAGKEKKGGKRLQVNTGS